METYRIKIEQKRPYFAEIPYALWGEVNYDSDGDCQKPTDQNWTEFDLRNRDTGEDFRVIGQKGIFEIRGKNPEVVARGAMFLKERSGGILESVDPGERVGTWSIQEAMKRTERIRREFPGKELVPFDSQLFWGSWKWVGGFGTEFTWVGRWIMNSVMTKDPRAVLLCVDWLKEGTVHPDQNFALRHALGILTGEDFPTDKEWIDWYSRKGNLEYPEPDFNIWKKDIMNAEDRNHE